ncbi:MAG: ABC transporter ATP-binding protein [Holophagae bacterium]|jgi:putative ABC transport system ATP-binding protein
MIRVESVNKRYPGAEVDVLKGVDLEVNEGDFVSIVGRSGSGKTTLLNLVGALDGSFEGSITVADTKLGSLDDTAASLFRSRAVGFVFQAYHLLEHLTCRENVALAALFTRGADAAAAAEVRRRADDLLREVGLDGYGSRHPGSLSGGERQRVALARALFCDPPLLLCDEPTGNLDLETGREVLELIGALHRERGVTVLAVTHDGAMTSMADRVYELTDGVLAPASEENR